MVTKGTSKAKGSTSSGLKDGKLPFKRISPPSTTNAASSSSTSAPASESTDVVASSKRSRTEKSYKEDDSQDEEEQDDKDDDFGGAKKKKKSSTTVTASTSTATTSTTTTTSTAAATAEKEASTSEAKKPAATKKGETKTPIRSGSHTNTTMPASLDLPKAPEGCIKIASWNVSGLNASLKKGFKTYIAAEDADVICLQEHKVNQPLMNLVNSKVYPFSWWGFEEKKGYAGVAMFSKTTPISVTAGLSTHPDPSCTKGRIVTLEFPTCYVLGCYVPNAGQGLVRLKERMVWDKAMKEWLLELKSKGKSIIWTGDLNVCHKPIDLRNPTTNTMSAGFTKEERAGFSEILDGVELVDTFREIQGDGQDATGQYTYFSYRFQCRVKGIGWRLDYFVTDKEFYQERVKECVIREECYGASDHVPIVLVVKGEL